MHYKVRNNFGAQIILQSQDILKEKKNTDLDLETFEAAKKA